MKINKLGHKIKSRNTTQRSRSPEYWSRCRNRRSRSPEYAMLTGCSRMNSYMKELDLNKAPLNDVAKAAGERDAKMSIACLSGGFPVITELTLPRALDVKVPGQVPTVAAPAREPERMLTPQAAALRGPFVTEGSTICTDLKSMIRAAVMQRAGITTRLSLACIFAPQTLPVRLLGESSMPGITVVQVGSDQALARSEDVTN